MGLDQYVFNGTDKNAEEVAYWRKHNRLQGWMENLWRSEKGGEGEFNCVDVELTLEDLDQLEQAINEKSMPETAGFFFGSDSYEDYEKYHKDYDLDFIAKARRMLNEGEKLYYHSWW